MPFSIFIADSLYVKASIESGLLVTAVQVHILLFTPKTNLVYIQAVRQAIEALGQDPRNRAGIVTFDSSVHFYALRPPRAEPQLVVFSMI